MLKTGITIREATETWVHEMNAIPRSMIETVMEANPEDWHEVTPPARGDKVYVYESALPEGCTESYGEIANFLDKADVYLINLDDGNTIEVGEKDFTVEKDSWLPEWSMMWSFGDSADDYWLEEMGGIQIMADCGFRIYESEEYGYFFGLDGGGYDFYKAHWIPLYKKRGLQWHDPEAEQREQMILQGYNVEQSEEED